MHTGSILILWVVGALCVQRAEGLALAGLVAASLILALVCARAQCVRLLMRIRILLLAIGVLFAWFTPGEAVLMDWPRISPSREGLLLALTHAGRLVALVCWVAVLLGRMTADCLVSGLYALVRPWEVIGLPAQRIALRLLLVLRYADTVRSDGRSWRDWRQWLNPPSVADVGPVQLARQRLNAVDVALPIMAGGLLMWWWLM